MDGKGNSFANGASNSQGNGDSIGNGATDPNWQRRAYGWLADLSCWSFMEP